MHRIKLDFYPSIFCAANSNDKNFGVRAVKQIRNPNIEIRKERGSRVGCRGENPLSLDARPWRALRLWSARTSLADLIF
jgi:hypothetical protein